MCRFNLGRFSIQGGELPPPEKGESQKLSSRDSQLCGFLFRARNKLCAASGLHRCSWAGDLPLQLRVQAAALLGASDRLRLPDRPTARLPDCPDCSNAWLYLSVCLHASMHVIMLQHVASRRVASHRHMHALHLISRRKEPKTEFE